MAQRQFRTDDTSTWNDRFGNGSDGAYAPSTGTDAPIDSACTGTINTTSLTATNAGFATGQLILIHQTQGTGAGQWELNKIASYTAGTITTSYPLIYGYVSGAQVLVMPQYSSGSIAGGVTLTGKAWNGTVGGIYAKFCNGTFAIAGTLTSNSVGYRGANSIVVTNSTPNAADGEQGEGTTGAGNTISNSANGSGGGGGHATAGSNSSGGGGGGNNAQGGSSGGTGGSSNGTANLVTANVGGAGGSGSVQSGAGGQNGTSGAGGSGGGFVLIIAKTITISGAINSIGGTGGNASGTSSNITGGAGGAGGSVLLKGQTLTLGSSLITATGGTFGTNVGVSVTNSGAGSVGRIHADYATSISGTTTPTIDSSLDAILAEQSNGNNYAFFI